MIEPSHNDALIIVDVQKDFLPGGALAIEGGDQIIPRLNRYVEKFRKKSLPIVATRDWHPPNHCSFISQGGPWPPHCVAGTPGAQFADGLQLPPEAIIISKATDPDQEAYSGFQLTDLEEKLRQMGVRRLFIGGLATDYCVLNTVRDALQRGFEVILLTDAIRAVNANPGDEIKALEEMRRLGTQFTHLDPS